MVVKGCWIMETGPVILSWRLLEGHRFKGCWTEKGMGSLDATIH